jgi:L,D-transpeptidase catalytic domain
MRRSSSFVIVAFAIAVAASDAEARLDLYVDKTAQRISIVRNSSLLYVWPVSTGRDKFSTPNGVYAPERLERSWFSKAYYNAPMPHAIFFHNGYAIHGSYDIARLGGPASHGCVRLHPQDAALLYAMVEQEGPGNTTIVIGGDRPPNPLPPRYREFDEPPQSPYPREGAMSPDFYAPDPRMRPSYNAGRYIDGPGRRHGNNGQLPMRAPYPANRQPMPRLDAEAVEPKPGLRGNYRPTATTKSSPDRVSDEPADRRANPGDTAKSQSPASQPPQSAPTSPEQQQPTSGYKVLPRSYWAGASWRWRLKRDQEMTGGPSAPDSQ